MNAWDCPPNQVTLQIGDIVAFNGARHYVKHVNESGATLLPACVKFVTIETRFGAKASFARLDRSVTISKNIDRELLLHRLGEDGLKEFLARKGNRCQGGGEVFPTETTTGGDNGMGAKAKVDKKRARGGLAAAALETQTRVAKTRKKSGVTKKAATTGKQMAKIMGYSVCAVLRKLGNEGVREEHAKAILAKHGVKDMPERSLSVQLALGRAKSRPLAPLKDSEVKELRDSAPEPETKSE